MEYFRQRYIDELNSDEPVRVRSFEWPPADVLQLMSPNDFEAVFVEWIGDAKQAAKERAKEFLLEFACLDRFNRLHAQLKAESVIPFVGAGLSRATGFPLWGAFLDGLTADYPAAIEQVQELLATYKYEETAQFLFDRMGADIFAESIQNVFGSRIKSAKGPVRLLPLLFAQGCITTNFDYVLNGVYEKSEHPFRGEFSGAELKGAPRKMANERHCLLRLHGEADSAQGRILTTAEYKTCYGKKGTYHDLLKLLIANTSLLFLGCSLSVDRTVQALTEIKKVAIVETPRHYALLPLDEKVDREARRNELGRADIHPIWYPAETHDESIEDLLISLMDGAFHE